MEVSMALLKVPEVAQHLGVSDRRTRELVRKGILPSVRLGRQVRIDEDTLHQWIRGGGRGLRPRPTGRSRCSPGHERLGRLRRRPLKGGE